MVCLRVHCLPTGSFYITIKSDVLVWGLGWKRWPREYLLMLIFYETALMSQPGLGWSFFKGKLTFLHPESVALWSGLFQSDEEKRYMYISSLNL